MTDPTDTSPGQVAGKGVVGVSVSEAPTTTEAPTTAAPSGGGRTYRPRARSGPATAGRARMTW